MRVLASGQNSSFLTPYWLYFNVLKRRIYYSNKSEQSRKNRSESEQKNIIC